MQKQKKIAILFVILVFSQYVATSSNNKHSKKDINNEKKVDQGTRNPRRRLQASMVIPSPSANGEYHVNWNKFHYVKDESWTHWFIGPIMVQFGIPLALKGLRNWYWNRFFCGWLFGMVVSNAVERAIMVEYYQWQNYMWSAIVLFSAVAFAIVFFCTKKFAKMMTGCFAFATMGKCIGALVNSFLTDKMPGWVGLVIIGVFAIVGFILASKYPDIIVVVGTAWIGAYCLSAGVGTLFGHYPDPLYGVPWWVFWMYFLSQSLVFNLCQSYQCAQQNEPKEKSRAKRDTSVEAQVVSEHEIRESKTEVLSVELDVEYQDNKTEELSIEISA